MLKFNKKYWKYILQLYRFQTINDKCLMRCSKVKKTKIPLIFKNFSYILIYDGKYEEKIFLKYTNIYNK